MDKGVYCVNYSGGQVNISNGDFVFSTVEAYLIEGGKQTAPLKHTSLIGNGPTLLQNVTMIGSDPDIPKRTRDVRQGGPGRARRRRLPDAARFGAEHRWHAAVRQTK